MAFKVSIEVKDDIAEVTVSGDLTRDSAREFELELKKLTGIEPRPMEVVLLVRNLAYLSSAGVQGLLLLKKWLPGVVIRMIQPKATVLGTLIAASLINEVIIR